jgi:hypothetical protein
MSEDTSIWLLAREGEPLQQGTFEDGRFVPIDETPLEVTGEITVFFQDEIVHQAQTTAPMPSLREIVERLGYALTEDMDRILSENPNGPWPLEDLEMMFGPSDGDYQDDKTVEDCKERFPHKVTFAPWPAPEVDDGDEDTRL